MKVKSNFIMYEKNIESIILLFIFGKFVKNLISSNGMSNTL
jgi:hypothetical protein